ncbi:MAG: SDR family NAD(P)-dependent oxidoreductase [Pseudomonadota bacterium]
MTTRTILLTGATDGIGLETARRLKQAGHRLLIHGRSEGKLTAAASALNEQPGEPVETYRADLSVLGDVDALAREVASRHDSLDVLINNAGVFKIPNARTDSGLDVRFVVNTVAPYRLTRRLLPLLPAAGRVVNLSSAAQAPVDLEALAGRVPLNDNQAYAQSKLAITMWSFHLARELGPDGPAIIAVNPASFLGSKMVKEAYGTAGNDLGIGADILVRAATSAEFADATGRYFDNDQGRFGPPHPDALKPALNEQLVRAVDGVIARLETG